MHQRGHVMQIFIDGNANGVRRHDVFDLCLVGIALRTSDPERDVSVSDDAAKLALPLGNQAADVVLLHQLARSGNIRLG
jgi:hypothetical protein